MLIEWVSHSVNVRPFRFVVEPPAPQGDGATPGGNPETGMRRRAGREAKAPASLGFGLISVRISSTTAALCTLYC
jgi:hypothetical protein